MSSNVEYGVFLPVSDGGFIFSSTAPQMPSTYEYTPKPGLTGRAITVPSAG